MVACCNSTPATRAATTIIITTTTTTTTGYDYLWNFLCGLLEGIQEQTTRPNLNKEMWKATRDT
eukprot:3247516-Amphidinium_carterae.1